MHGKLRTLKPRTHEMRTCKLIGIMLVTVTAQKGGVGKTTTAVHVAAVLQQHAPTLLIDEEQGGATDWAVPGLLPFRTATETEAAQIHTEYTHRVVDTGARPTSAILQELATHSDLLLIPTTPDALALKALLKTLEVVRGSRYAVLLTITPPRPSRVTAEARQLLENLDVNLITADVPRAVALQKAALEGVTVDKVQDRRATELWEAYKRVGREVLTYER